MEHGAILHPDRVTGTSTQSMTANVGSAPQPCDDEPIRVPGAVQPHGALLAFSLSDRRVVIASANAVAMFGRPALGATASELLEPDVLHALDWERLPSAGPTAYTTWLGDKQADLVVHRVEDLLLAEWELVEDAHVAGSAWHAGLPQVLQRLTAASTVLELATVVVNDVRHLTGFDRVMLYRFDAHWNGEVIAEAVREDLPPYLGLHYPAADIPAQARALYEQNWLRLIPDTSYTPVPLVSGSEQDGSALDLSGSVLRSVSPIHLQYLANMGVRASMSVSLLSEGRLWGLIACHHVSGPRRPSYPDRVVAEFIGRTASVLLSSRDGSYDGAQALEVARHQAVLMDALSRASRTPLLPLAAPATSALRLIPCAGAAIKLDGTMILLGTTPSAERTEQLVAELLDTRTVSSESLGRDLPAIHDLSDITSGALVVPVGLGGDFLAWFRPEAPKDVRWAGDPTTAKEAVAGSGHLSPRHSFEEWSETVRGMSAPWLPYELAAARQLGKHLYDSALVRAQDNNRLAVTLQRTLLAESLPEIEGLTLSARHLPAASYVVGGDWFDLVPLPSGSLAIVLGDVAGHGLHAAAITAQLRHGLRAYLLHETGPAAALTALNQIVTALLPTEFATAVIVELDPATGVLTLASAGHPPPLLLTATGSRLLPPISGPGLELSRLAIYEQDTVTLTGDDRLVLYSDGLIERRGTGLQQDLDRLLSASGVSERDPDALLTTLLRALTPANSTDVTLLAVGLR
jgi:chemotaxis family two-component system sensor kinase Cph1